MKFNKQNEHRPFADSILLNCENYIWTIYAGKYH
jgi:hypothetical protein